MNRWIFQAKVDRFDLKEKVKPGDSATWYATRYSSQMKPGDKVYFWQAGEDSIRGVYGVGTLKSEPYRKEGWAADGVDVEFVEALESPLSATEIKENDALKSMQVVRAPQGTNFLLQDDEAEVLDTLVSPRVKKGV